MFMPPAYLEELSSKVFGAITGLWLFFESQMDHRKDDDYKQELQITSQFLCEVQLAFPESLEMQDMMNECATLQLKTDSTSRIAKVIAAVSELHKIGEAGWANPETLCDKADDVSSNGLKAKGLTFECTGVLEEFADRLVIHISNGIVKNTTLSKHQSWFDMVDTLCSYVLQGHALQEFKLLDASVHKLSQAHSKVVALPTTLAEFSKEEVDGDFHSVTSGRQAITEVCHRKSEITKLKMMAGDLDEALDKMIGDAEVDNLMKEHEIIKSYKVAHDAQIAKANGMLFDGEMKTWDSELKPKHS